MNVALHRALMLVDLDRLHEALPYAREAVTGDEGEAEAWCVLSHCETAAGDPRSGLLAAERAIGVAPHEARGHLLAAQALSAGGDRATALRAATEACRLDPQSWNAHAMKAHVSLSTRRRPSRAALAPARKAVELAPEVAGAHTVLGDALLYSGQRRAAARSYREALAIAPEDPSALNGLTLAELSRGRFRAATANAAAAVSVNPGDSDSGQQLPMTVLLGVASASWGVVMIGLLLARMQLMAGSDDPGMTHPTAMAIRVTGLAGVVVLAAIQGWRWRGMPAAVRGHLLARLSAGGPLRASVGLGALGVLLLFVAAVPLWSPLYPDLLATVAGLLGSVVGWRASRREVA